MQLFHTSWHLQVQYHHDLCGVYHQSLYTNHMPQQVPKRNTKQPILEIEHDLVSSTVIQHQAQAYYMALNKPKYSPVIKIYLQELMNKLLECRNNHARKDCRRILQSKRHYSVLETTPVNRKGFLAPILQRDFDLMVPGEPISERVYFLASYIIQDLISERVRERIMHASVIQPSKVDAYPYFFFLFLFLNHYRAYPIRFFQWLNDSSYEHLV